MKDQRKHIVRRRSKSQLGVYIQSQLDWFRRNRPFVCTCCAGDECSLSHSFPRNSNAHRTTTGDPNPDPGAQDAEQVEGSNLVKHDGGGFARVKQNKAGGEIPRWWFQRGFGSSELLGCCRGFDGRRRGWDANYAVGWGRANDGVSSWGKGNYSGGGGSNSGGGFAWGSQNNYSGGGGPSWSSLGDGGRAFGGPRGGVNWDFNSKNEETNVVGGWETNTVDDDYDAWGYKPNAGASSSSGSWRNPSDQW